MPLNHPDKLAIKAFKDALAQAFIDKHHLSTVTHQLVTFIDGLLIKLFQTQDLTEDFCLLALGGYGRQELQLYSDVDLLLLVPNNPSKSALSRAEFFIQSCWDMGLDISHQLMTVDACAEFASHDLNMISSLLDARMLCGQHHLLEALLYQTNPQHMWNSHDYFFAKLEEQALRYKKFDETAYNLEPNVKFGVGGLRDIQMIMQIFRRHFSSKKLAEGIQYGFITAKEYEELIHCQQFLWKIRFALHALTHKREERLLFDHQIKLAVIFGYEDHPEALGIEQFMKAYFKIIKRSRELIEMLLQWFSETIVFHQKQAITPLDDYFQLSNQYIEIRHPSIFHEAPETIFKIFLWIAENPEIQGITANTIRLIRQHLYLIDIHFCNSLAMTQLFMQIMRVPQGPFGALEKMSRYGVLDYYMDSFAAVTGQIQYDLFHVYTVDQHTLFVIRNLCRFLQPEFAQQFSLAHALMPTLEHQDALYIAALFHDIAKGRGGDHSKLGAEDAEIFAKRHRLSIEKEKLIVFLVRHHLLMSHTAQRQDIYDPKTIQEFSSQLPQPWYLDYLYVLTVADICATNPTLWTTWKDSLLRELYRATQEYKHQQIMIIDETQITHERKMQALHLLLQQGFSTQPIETLWKHFKSRYFLHESAEIIAQHTCAILTAKQFPLIMIMPHHTQGGTEICIYMPHRDDRFMITTTVLASHQITIQEANIMTSDHQFDLDIYVILNANNEAILDKQQESQMHAELVDYLSDSRRIPTLSKHRLTRSQAHFKIPTTMTYTDDDDNQLTRLFLVTSDRSGLLAQLSQAFLAANIQLLSAKIATAGARVEDMFFIRNASGMPLTLLEKEALQTRVYQCLNFR